MIQCMNNPNPHNLYFWYIIMFQGPIGFQNNNRDFDFRVLHKIFQNILSRQRTIKRTWQVTDEKNQTIIDLTCSGCSFHSIVTV